MSDPDVLQVDVRLRQPAHDLDVCFVTSAPWTCLFGASGSGKTTILRAIAGFVQPDAGSIRLGGRVLFDSQAGVSIQAHRRGVRTATQQAFLFPGTVAHNVGYGMPADHRRLQVKRLLKRFHLTGLAGQTSRALSGGERQRVSLARAVGAALHGAEPVRLLQLDEPFAGLDAGLRDELASALRDLLAEAKIPVLSVTHDVAEAFLLQAEVVRLFGGRVSAQGQARQVMAEERQRLLDRLER